MKITAISDTHGQHHRLNLEPGDLLIHAGDISPKGTWAQVQDFLNWFSIQPFRYKIFIAGNHDFFFEKTEPSIVRSILPSELIYLNDSGITLEGIRIWGSPVQPWFMDWAFNRQRGKDIDKHWQMIPDDTDILITHGPAYSILDQTISGEHVGCRDLLNRIEQVRPRYHLAGHIHEAYGRVVQDGTTFLNASVLDVKYRLANRPWVFEY